MKGPEDFREQPSSLSEDEEESLQRASTPSDEDDAFSPRLFSRGCPPPIDTKDVDDSFFRRSGEDDTPRGVCSPLVEAFSTLSTRGPFSPINSGSDVLGGFMPGEPGTPLRRNILLTPSQDSMRNRPPQVRTLYSRNESKTNKNPCGGSTRLCALAALSPAPDRSQRAAGDLSLEKDTLADFHPTLSASCKLPPAPPAFPVPTTDNHVPFDARPPRHHQHLSPPPRSRAGHGRRVSLERGDLMPSPIAQPQCWTPTFNYSAATLAAVSALDHPPAHPMRLSSPTPIPSGMRAMMSPAPSMEPRAMAATTPNDNLKMMVAPSRPSKREKKANNPCRVICPASPMTPSSAGTVPLDDVPALAGEAPLTSAQASPCLILNKSDGARAGKLVRRMSEQENELEAPAVFRRMKSCPETRPAPPLKQTPEQQRIELERCRGLVTAMLRKGTRLVCLDWDMTVVGCHTNSQWTGPPDQLAKWIRPEFKNFITAAFAHNLRVAFVSFSGQTQLVYGALRSAFGEDAFRSGKYVVRCSDKQWEAEKAPFEALFPHALRDADKSKLSHICSAVEVFWRTTSSVLIDKENSNPQRRAVRPEDIVLIDDDEDNITDANDHGVCSFHMDVDKPSRFLDLLEAWSRPPHPHMSE